MTLLITVAGKDYALSSSDTRISVLSGNRYISVDEKFNKHIIFNCDGLRADVSFTGVARWSERGKTVKLYDVISDSLARSATKNSNFCSLCLNLISDLTSKLDNKLLKNKEGDTIIELHIIGYMKDIPIPFIAVISTFRNKNPWATDSELQWEYEFPDMNLYLKVAKSPEVIFGGMDTALSNKEKTSIRSAVCAGADAYNVSKMSSNLISKASTRSTSIGSRSVSILIPRIGLIDTNLWQKRNEDIVAYLPKIVFSNGTNWNPSEFPVDLNMVANGCLPKQSLFFKSIIDYQHRPKIRRMIFKNKKGKEIPGIFGILGLALFGELPNNYWDPLDQ